VAKVLVVHGDAAQRAHLRELLATRRIEGVATAPAEADAAAAARPELVVFDLPRDEPGALETLRRLTQRAPGSPVLVLAADPGVEAVVAAMRAGAADVLPRPVDDDRLLETVELLLAMRRGATGLFRVPAIGGSRAFLESLNLATRFAVPELNVLLLGETGVGKDVFARLIHGASKRCAGAFVAVDCATLPSELIESELFGHEKGAFTGATSARTGRFEMAQGGTLFLDEIGNLPPAAQAKLLRVLQERHIVRVGGTTPIRLDVRLLAATNVDLEDAVARGTFRRDLYFRLNEVAIAIPPLRERGDDVLRLAEHFAAAAAQRLGRPTPTLAAETRAVLLAHRWPGNVRELEHAMTSAVVLAADVVLPDHLPRAVGGRSSLWPGDGPAVPAAPRSDLRPAPGGPESSGAGTAAAADGRLRVSLELDLSQGPPDLKEVARVAAERAEAAVLAELLARRTYGLAELSRVLGVDPKTLRVKLRRYGLKDD
jgi:DNA-binding NtrC family response regulator